MILANLGIVFYRKTFELGEVISALLTRKLIPLLSVFEVVVVFVFLLQGRQLAVTAAVMGTLLDDGALDRLDQHEGPDQVEQLEQAEQDEEEVVEGRELEEVASVKKRGVQDPEREYSAPRDNPSECEESKKDVAGVLESGVLQQFGKLQQVVGAVVHQDHKGANPGEMGGPGEGDEENCGVVMNEHLPEVLPLHVKELADREGPIEGEFNHVVDSDIWLYLECHLIAPLAYL